MIMPFWSPYWIWYPGYVPGPVLYRDLPQKAGSYAKQRVNLRLHAEVRNSTKIEDIL